ncbi:MAG: hypothetical protein ACK5Q5_16390 [Planctomycetaceae bacterium]
MFDHFDQNQFITEMQTHFNHLDQSDVRDICQTLFASLQATFDEMFITNFVYVDRIGGWPWACGNKVFGTRQATEYFLRNYKIDNYEPAMLLLDKELPQ